MHNGQIGGYRHLKRQIEAALPDGLYEHRLGTTDSEALFLMALANGLRTEPVAAMERTLSEVQTLLDRAGVTEPLRFTSCYTDGEALWAYRWASDDRAPTLYYREDENGVLIVSEPIDEGVRNWNVVPKQSVLRVDSRGIQIEPMKIACGVAA